MSLTVTDEYGPVVSVVLDALGDECAVAQVAGQGGPHPAEVAVAETGGGAGPQQGVARQPPPPRHRLLRPLPRVKLLPLRNGHVDVAGCGAVTDPDADGGHQRDDQPANEEGFQPVVAILGEKTINQKIVCISIYTIKFSFRKI